MSGSSLGVFNQASWSGVGDVDECWIIATYWPLVAAGVMTRDQLPSIAAFRRAAGRPDKKGPSGGNNDDLLKALKVFAPTADIKSFDGTLNAFSKQLAFGYIASVSLLSKYLPAYLRFGFDGAHQVSIFLQSGKFYLMNPLAKEGSALIQISGADLAKASGALFGDSHIHAVLIKAGKGKPAAKPQQRHFPAQPRDIPAPFEPAAYMDPRAVGRAYKEKHRDTMGNVADDGPRGL